MALPARAPLDELRVELVVLGHQDAQRRSTLGTGRRRGAAGRSGVARPVALIAR